MRGGGLTSPVAQLTRLSPKCKTNIFLEHTYDLMYSQRGDILQIIYLDVQSTLAHFCPPSAKLMFQA